MNPPPPPASSIPCKLCGERAQYVGYTHNWASQTSRLDAYECGGCGLVFVGNLISNDELAAAYGKLDSAAYYEEIRETNRLKFQDAIADLQQLASKDVRILDIGTGDGAFVELLLQQGYGNVAAHEVPGMDLSGLRAKGVAVYEDFDYSTVPTDSFDVITLLDVAEHVPDPLYLFTCCHRILGKGGLVYFHAPAVTPTDRLMHRFQRFPGLSKIGRAWQTSRTSIYHLQNYTPKAIEYLFNCTRFETVNLDVENELSWPVASYVRVYLCQRYGLPTALAPLLAPLVWPLVATDFLNPNKAVVTGRKR